LLAFLKQSVPKRLSIFSFERKEGKMKKILAIMAFAAFFALLSTAVMAGSAPGWWWVSIPFKNFQGTYEMIASGSCIHSENGYDINHSPLPGKVYAGTTVANGTWIFNRGGKGTYSFTNYATIFPTADATPPLGIRVLSLNDLPFTYEITPFGDITVHAGGIALIGSISIDRNTMTLLSANQIQEFGAPLWYTICNTARTLIRVWDIREEK
jgi:hypothetical protein